MKYEFIFYEGSHASIDWDEVNQSIEWKAVTKPNLNRLHEGASFVFFSPPWTYYSRCLHKFHHQLTHVAHGHTYNVYGHSKEEILVILKACPEIVLKLTSVTSVGANVEITFAYALSGEPFITLTLDRDERYSLVTIENQIRLHKNHMQNKLTFMYEDQILRKNTVMWHPLWPTILEPLRRLRRRTSYEQRGQLQLEQYFA